MSIIKALHTSNLHLGARFPGFESETEAMRVSDVNMVFDAFKNYIIDNAAQLVVISGDLFDKMNPKRETISTALSAFAEIAAKLPETRIAITPGKEEFLMSVSGGVESNLSLFAHLGNVRVLGAGGDPETELFDFGGQKVRVTACAAELFFSPDFKKKMIPQSTDAPGIFMLSVRRGGKYADISDEMIRERILPHIKERGYSYAALGGRHKLSLLESGEFTAVFPGSLERFDFEKDRERKSFVIFNIEDGKIRPPETVRSKARPLEYMNIACSYPMTIGDMENSLAGLGKKGDRDKILYISLDGQLPFELYDLFINSEKVKQLREKFACVHIENRMILLDGDSRYDFDALRVNSPADEFRLTMEKEIEAARDRGEEAKLLTELLEMGVKEIEEGP